MGRGVEFEGRIYCDWRINVSGCVDDYFFYGAAVFQFSCILTTLILQIITCSFRVTFFLSHFFLISFLSLFCYCLAWKKKLTHFFLLLFFGNYYYSILS